MKILYAIGDRIGGDAQLSRFLQNVQGVDIAIAAHMKSSQSFTHIDWTLDALKHKTIAKQYTSELTKLFGHPKIPLLNLKNAKIFIKEVAEFEPNLIISDGEVVSAHLAKTLNVPLWYCSSIHLLDGIRWEKNQLRYMSLLENTRKRLSKFPTPDRIFVYSPFGDIKFRPNLNEGYEWCTPYYNKGLSSDDPYDNICIVNDLERFGSLAKVINSLSCSKILYSPYTENFTNVKCINKESDYINKLKDCKNIFTTGETSYVADAFYNNKSVRIAPSLNDPEALLNAILIKEYNIGSDLGQVELLESFAVDEMERSFASMTNTGQLSKQPYTQLDREIQACIT